MNDAKTPRAARTTKRDAMLKLLRRKKGASLAELMSATGWQAHSVRGAIAGSLKRSATIVSEKPEGGERRYRAVAD
ncbi:MAG: DUF3489 domain-containing protein [Pseudomonadota bacterium]